MTCGGSLRKKVPAPAEVPKSLTRTTRLLPLVTQERYGKLCRPSVETSSTAPPDLGCSTFVADASTGVRNCDTSNPRVTEGCVEATRIRDSVPPRRRLD